MRRVWGADGNVAATIDALGRISLGRDGGEFVGVVRSDTDVFAGEAGVQWLGRVDSDRRIFNAEYEFVGTIDANGRVADVTGRVVGRAEAPIDGAALLLLVGMLEPDALAESPPPDGAATVMEEALSLQDDAQTPGVRKNYKPLTDDDIFGTPFRKK